MHKFTIHICVVFLLGLTLTACNAGIAPASSQAVDTPTTAVQMFEGRYEYTAEMSSFIPCGMGEKPGPGKGYWLVPDQEFSQMYQKTLTTAWAAVAGTLGPDDELAIYVRFQGVLSPSAGATSSGYGPSNLYQREVKVTRALEASYYLFPYKPNPCKR
jgi:hypothetical protein